MCGVCLRVCIFAFVFFAQLFINNAFVDSVSGKTFPTINPSTGAKIADVQEGDKVSIHIYPR